jgi:endonuclease YncB( thermonuclease family)
VPYVKSLGYSIILASIFLTAVVIACIDLSPSGVIIYAFDQNPAGLDEGNEYEEAKEFLNETCMWEEVKLDVDAEKQYDSYYRILAVVYVDETNLNEKIVREGYVEISYIPPSEFDCREWGA